MLTAPSRRRPTIPIGLCRAMRFQNLMYTNATVSNVQYSNVSDKQGFAAEVKIGVAFGVDFSLETTDSRATDATISTSLAQTARACPFSSRIASPNDQQQLAAFAGRSTDRDRHADRPRRQPGCVAAAPAADVRCRPTGPSAGHRRRSAADGRYWAAG